MVTRRLLPDCGLGTTVRGTAPVIAAIQFGREWMYRRLLQVRHCAVLCLL